MSEPVSETPAAAAPAAPPPAPPAAGGAGSGFVCVCVQKSVEFNIVDHKLHRATKDQELHEELEKLSACTPNEYGYQLGGGCRIIGASGSSSTPPLYIASWGESVAVLEGTLSNLTDLRTAFPSSHTTTSTTAVSITPQPAAADGPEAAAAAPAAQAQGEAPPAPGDAPDAPNPAHLLCLMYELIGSQLLELLRGKFSFCLYHGKTGRVLAARDGSGAVPLFQGMSAAQSLVISSREEFTASCTEVKEFAPGYFKYGWYAEPRKFGPSHAHGRSPSGHSHPRSGGSARSSMDHQRGGGSARTSMDQPRPHAPQQQQQVQQQVQPRGGSSRRSMDSGSSRRDSPDGDGGRGARKDSVGKGSCSPLHGQFRAQAQAQGPAAAAAEGWTVVGVPKRGAAAGAGFSPAPQGQAQGRRRSVDHKVPPREAGGRPKAEEAQGGPGRRSMDVHGSGGGGGMRRGFQWDVNAPAYEPQGCESH